LDQGPIGARAGPCARRRCDRTVVGRIRRAHRVAGRGVEVLLGIAIGPQGLGWAAPTGAIPHLASFGLVFLFFLAGLEIDLVGLRAELKCSSSRAA
jgi:predicted Kef-type K+ transport protein